MTALALTMVGTGIAPVRANPVVESIPVEVAETLEAALLRQAAALDPRVLALALQSHDSALNRGLLTDRNTLTVIDYSRPSVEPRFWVFDLGMRRVLFEELVAHGKNSGENFATEFSNVESSLQTSLGLFVTRDVYYGKHGESLRLEGLEPGVNDRALERAIVIHGAQYVSSYAVASLGFLGRSWGCPALSREAAPRVIDRIRGGSAVFAFYPDKEWLASSRFLRLTPEEMLDAPNAGSTTAPYVATSVPEPGPAAPVTFFPLRIALMS
ncbi:MAG: murein L,D-transpeptidase catalytic domain family protein [Candidatus Eisenbacteria bacterium]